MINMQRDSTNGSSKSVITDLASFCYSDSINMQSQDHEFPQTMQIQHFSPVMESFPYPFEPIDYSFGGGGGVSGPLPLPPPPVSHRSHLWEAAVESNVHQCSEMSSSAVNSYSCSSSSSSYSNSCNEPIQFSSTVMSGSGFVLAMQEILAEIACYVLENNEQMNYSMLSDQSIVSRKNLLPERESEEKKKHLLALLQLVDDKYNQCMDEIHTVTSAFHAVTELDPNLHARFALPTISFMYKSLRDRISSHILAIEAEHLIRGEVEANEEKKAYMEKQWALQQLSKRDHPFWRPQRGLPEKSVSVLKAWMFQNFLHPYPEDAEKHLLALRSGLTRNQVSNWFINARVRLWKPMIEEMYAETSRRKARLNNEETDGSRGNRNLFENTRFTMD